MAQRIKVDPITRIEGHLRIDVEVDGGRINRAWSSAQAFRGIETILRGRDPRDAWAMCQRFCGVCTTTHALCSIRAVEDAYGIPVPVNAQMMRNLVMGMQSLQDHIVHFYHLTALDWVDIISATNGDPRKAAQVAETLSDWPRNSYNSLKTAKEKLLAFAATGNLGIYGNAYWGHSDMRLSPEINLLAFDHYLQALEYQRKIAEAVAIIGSKNPHIQNLCVGGVTTAIDMDSIAALNMERIKWIRTLLDETAEFVKKVYIPDVLAIAAAYKDWFNLGKCGCDLIATPDFPMDTDGTKFLMTGGLVRDGQLTEFATWKDERLRAGITEHTAHSWYESPDDLHPYEGDQKPKYDAPADDMFDEAGKYSWCKSPRFEKRIAQTGPAAQIIVNYLAGNEKVKKYVDFAAGKLGISLNQLDSTMGRNAARAIRALCCIDDAYTCLETFLDNYAKGDHEYVTPSQYTKTGTNDQLAPLAGEVKGVGFNEAPRGMLSHWIKISKNHKIANYSAVVPSTWDAGPGDDAQHRGPYEQSLIGTPVADAHRPVEVVRAIHSFDPCIACAVHTVDPNGKEYTSVKVR